MDEQAETKERILFQAVVKDKNKVEIQLKSGHVPTLVYAAKLLDLTIENMIIGQEQQKAPVTIMKVDGGMASLKNILSGRRK